MEVMPTLFHYWQEVLLFGTDTLADWVRVIIFFALLAVAWDRSLRAFAISSPTTRRMA